MYYFLGSYGFMDGETWLLGRVNQTYALPMDFSEKNKNWQKKEIYQLLMPKK
jgi:hypothetical protein